jgi:hypothetical protein
MRRTRRLLTTALLVMLPVALGLLTQPNGAAQGCAVGQVGAPLADPADTGLPGFVDVVSLAVSVQGTDQEGRQIVRASFQLRDLPPQLVLNRPAYDVGTLEYHWIAWLDADGNTATGASVGQSGEIGADYMLYAYLAGNDQLPRPATIDTRNLPTYATSDSDSGTNAVTVDLAKRTITIVGIGSSMNPEAIPIGAAARFGFEALYLADDPNSKVPVFVDVNDCAGTGPPPVGTPAPTSTVVGIDGATLTCGSGTIVVQVPPEAVGSDVTVSFEPLPVPPPEPGYRPLGAFDLSANGGQIDQFARQITIRVRYDPAALGGADERTIAVFARIDGRRERLPSTVDVTSRIVTATTEHFTEFEFAASELPTPTPLRREPAPTPCPGCRRLYLPIELKTFGGRW